MYMFNIKLDLLECREEEGRGSRNICDGQRWGLNALLRWEPSTLLLDQFLSSDPQVAVNDWG